MKQLFFTTNTAIVARWDLCFKACGRVLDSTPGVADVLHDIIHSVRDVGKGRNIVITTDGGVLVLYSRATGKYINREIKLLSCILPTCFNTHGRGRDLHLQCKTHRDGALHTLGGLRTLGRRGAPK